MRSDAKKRMHTKMNSSITFFSNPNQVLKKEKKKLHPCPLPTIFISSVCIEIYAYISVYDFYSLEKKIFRFSFLLL